ncbi:hypothetical protein Dimus_020466 [Dionaea muscipula]
MDDLGSLWTLQEKLLYMAYELESAKLQANDEVRKSKENAFRLLNLLKIACQERDEAKDQLQKLMHKMFIPSPQADHHDFYSKHSIPLPCLSPESHLTNPPKGNSSITESNSISEALNYSSPVDSFFDSVSSADLSTMKSIPDSSNLAILSPPLMQDCPGPFPNPDNANPITGSPLSQQPNKNDQDFIGSVPTTAEVDQDDMLIYSLIKGRELPQKGRLLKAVVDAGPLLQGLMVAGPLPSWRVPPPLQASQIPPVGIRGSDGEVVVAQRQGSNSNLFGKRLMVGSGYDPSLVLNFAGGASSGLCLNGGGMLATTGSHCSMPKRQRIMH